LNREALAVRCGHAPGLLPAARLPDHPVTVDSPMREAGLADGVNVEASSVNPRATMILSYRDRLAEQGQAAVGMVALRARLRLAAWTVSS
jgi:hypothetical protein